MLEPSSLPPANELPRPFAVKRKLPRSTLGADGNRIVAVPLVVKRLATEARPTGALPTKNATPSTELSATRPAIRENNTMRSP